VNARRMIRFGLGAVLVALALPGAASADVPVLNPTGSLTFSWRGDLARGCAAAGVCRVSGSLEVIPESQAGGSESPRQTDIMINDGDAVARVSDPGFAAAQPRTCADLVPVAITLGVVSRGDGGRHAVINFPEQPPSSGRCAGPTASELDAISLPARRLPGRQEAYDMSGHATLHAGPYLVTIASTLHARRPASTPGGGLALGGGSSSATSPRRLLRERVVVDYRLERVTGKLTTEFGGRPDPACLPLDACGASGSLIDAISHARGSMELEADRVVQRPVSAAAALRDLRAGRLRIEFVAATTPIASRLSATAAWSGGPTCRDHAARGLSLNGNGKRSGVGLSLALADSGQGDLSRTNCAGPASADVLGPGGSIAGATVPVRTLGDRHLHVTLSGDGTFVGGGYEGSRRGTVSIDLRLLHVHGGTRRVPAGFP
jgi:hypothetical protein